mmetsp:Transcript_43440/g.72320  ORF Transcript_43440/g.72320 Transcript_43440/m.72320 type:complete len:94 (+) Transcript_43440:613-894(+)
MEGQRLARHGRFCGRSSADVGGTRTDVFYTWTTARMEISADHPLHPRNGASSSCGKGGETHWELYKANRFLALRHNKHMATKAHDLKFGSEGD